MTTGVGVRAARVSALVAALTLSTGCTEVRRVAVGPVVAFPEGHAAGGGAVVAESASGSSDARGGIVAGDIGARGQFTARSQALSAYLGPYLGGWLGRSLVDGSLRVGGGAELLDGRVFALASFGATVGVGFTLTESSQPAQQQFWIGEPGVVPERYDRRARVLLTLGLGGDANVRFTRGPLLSTTLLFGVTWVEEDVPSKLPDVRFPWHHPHP